MNEISKSTKIMIWILVIVGIITTGLSIMSLMSSGISSGSDTSTSVEQPF